MPAGNLAHAEGMASDTSAWVNHPDAPYWRSITKRSPIVWITMAICSNGLLGDKGCGLPVRWFYVTGRGSSGHPRFAVCPVCGRHAHFAFWKMKVDRTHQPTAEQEADVRALLADMKRMAKGEQPRHETDLATLIRIHSPLGAQWIVQGLIRVGRGG